MGRNATLKTIGNYIYNIDELLSIKVWEIDKYDIGEPPFLYQPTYPDGSEFKSVEEADAWAEAHINKIIAAQEQPIVE